MKGSYQKGNRMYISDHLSRSPFLKKQQESRNVGDYDIFAVNDEEQLMKDIEEIDPNIYHNVTDGTLKKVAEAASEDENLLTLATMIMYGCLVINYKFHLMSEIIGRIEMNCPFRME